MLASRLNLWSARKPLHLAGLLITCLLQPACDPVRNASIEQRSTAATNNERGSSSVAAPASERTVVAATPNPSSPVTATLRSEKTAVRPGESFAVTIDVQIAGGWHIYAVDRPTGPAVKTQLQLDLPKGFESAGDWSLPDPSLDESSAGEVAFVYRGSVAFRRSVRVKPGTSPGAKPLRCMIHYQACDQFSCRPPADLKLEAFIQVVP
ncbi:MAG TPA: protein-disulfide reductase DsbD domain-containing protein [Planctomycetaceae bacterium]|nr:protein-disulfide reductase DsbD domain-containing protein [Planctomycetaceae bacterium]